MNRHGSDPLRAFEAQLEAEITRGAESEALWLMTADQRAEALFDGRLTQRQINEWRRERPHEFPPAQAVNEEQAKRLWAMTAAERIEAMYAGGLTDFQLFVWSRQRPHEVPRIDNEYEWLVWRTADWIEAREGAGVPPRKRATSCPHTGRGIPECDCAHCVERLAAAFERLRERGLL